MDVGSYHSKTGTENSTDASGDLTDLPLITLNPTARMAQRVLLQPDSESQGATQEFHEGIKSIVSDFLGSD